MNTYPIDIRDPSMRVADIIVPAGMRIRCRLKGKVKHGGHALSYAQHQNVDRLSAWRERMASR